MMSRAIRKKVWLASERAEEMEFLRNECGQKAWNEREFAKFQKMFSFSWFDLIIGTSYAILDALRHWSANPPDEKSVERSP
jgi:hypothetical protein